MSITGIRDAIETSLATISGLAALDNAPDTVPALPVAWVAPEMGGRFCEYNITGSSSVIKLHFIVTLLVTKAGIADATQEALDDYIVPTGDKSIKAKVEAATLSTHASYALVSEAFDYGGLEYNSVLYIGCKFRVEVIV